VNARKRSVNSGKPEPDVAGDGEAEPSAGPEAVADGGSEREGDGDGGADVGVGRVVAAGTGVTVPPPWPRGQSAKPIVRPKSATSATAAMVANLPLPDRGAA
jgi:hypothetical protein